MSVKRNSRTAECPEDSQGISAAREFRRNIEYLKAEMTERQTQLANGRDNANGRERKSVLKRRKDNT